MSSHVEYQRFSPAEHCTEEGCRARRWYIEDGKKFCQRGHEQLGFTQTEYDGNEAKNEGKKARKEKYSKSGQNERFLSRWDARILYLESYQLILWKQCAWFLREKGLPQEFETVVRDLWGLRLKVLPEEEDMKKSSWSVLGFSSTSEGETASDGTTGRNSKLERATPKLTETLATCYLATVLMRLPLSLGELFKWASSGDLPFTRAIRELPDIMHARLPGRFRNALGIRAPLRGSAIHSAVVKLAAFYHLHFEMEFPALNTPLLLYKHVRSLGLPVEIYQAVQRLAKLLDLTFEFPISQFRHGLTIISPETRLMSLVVIATKLSQPLDHLTRFSKTASDPTTVQIDWQQWIDVMTEPLQDGLPKGAEINVTENDVLRMSDKALDDYLDWHQLNWIDIQETHLASQILELFPLQTVKPRAEKYNDEDLLIDRLIQVQAHSTLREVKPVPTDATPDVLRPGEQYRRYRTAQELSSESRAFYNAAAKTIGIDLPTLVRGTYSIEVQLEHWAIQEKRKLGSQHS